MAGTLLAPPNPFATTMADVLARLGDIPPERVLWSPTPGTATEADLLSCGRKMIELIDGTLVEKAMGTKASFATFRMIGFLFMYLEQHKMGRAFTPDLIVRLGQQRRLPDICFYSWSTWPEDSTDWPNIMPAAPDLAIEVLSPSNTRAEMKRKRAEFFAAGTKVFWIVNPDKQTVAVYTSVDKVTTLTKSDTLTGGDVLPGFTLVLADLFESY